ncbi:uncharacterized protein LOC144149013 [Haemaphysalis longicornis]
MSRADYEFPVKQRDPYLGRHDLPRFSEDSQGNLVMEPLNTEDLPQAPPPVSRPVWFRLAAAVIGALVMALFTVIGAAFVRAQASAAFLNATGTPDDDTTPRRRPEVYRAAAIAGAWLASHLGGSTTTRPPARVQSAGIVTADPRKRWKPPAVRQPNAPSARG